ncbi:MAG: putative methylase, partial [Bacteroidetes bacterium]|nr:putative methylase [Bacteroidota bacterium]
VQMTAIKKDLGCITLIEKPCEAAQIYAVERDPFVASLIPTSETALMMAVTKMPEVLLDVPYPSPELYQAALNTAFPGLTSTDISPEEFKELFSKLKAASNVDERKSIIETFRSAALQPTQTHIEAIQILQGNAPERILEGKFEQVRDQIPNEETKILGKMSYYGFDGKVSEVMEYTDKESYLNAIKKKLNYNPDGFKHQTLTSDSEVRKSVDDIIYGAYGADNPHDLGWYFRSNDTKLSGLKARHNIPSKNATLCYTSYRILSADVVLDEERKITTVSNPMITDKFTGSSSPLDTKGIDPKKLSGTQMKNLLSGKQVSGLSGLAGPLGLNKTPAGWCLSIGKKIVNTADSEAGI